MWFSDWGKSGNTLFPLTPFIIRTGRLSGPRSQGDTHSHTCTGRNRRTFSVRTSVESLHQSHRCSSWHLCRLRWGGTGGLSGVCGAVEGQTGPQSLVESFLCGTQSIVCAGKGHEDGNTAQSWTLSSDSSPVRVCTCLFI